MTGYFQFRVIFDYAFAIGSVIVIYFLNLNGYLDWSKINTADFRYISGLLFQVSTGLLGFVLAAGTFLVTHVNQQRFDFLRSSKGWKQFPDLLSSSLWRLFVLSLASAISCVIRDSLVSSFSYILAFLCVLVVCSTCALIWVNNEILRV